MERLKNAFKEFEMLKMQANYIPQKQYQDPVKILFFCT